MNNQFRKKLFEAIITLLIGLFATILAVVLIFLIRNFFEPQKGPQKQLEDIKENTQQIKKSLTPYESRDKMNKSVIIENFSNTAINEVSTHTVNKQLDVLGPFNNGYLYIKVSIDDQPIDSKGSVYTKLTVQGNDGNYNELGGHLITSKSLDTPKNNGFSELLFPLSDIKYKKDFRNSELEVTSADWLKLLNIVGVHRVISFVSTVGQGKIVELSIYYECTTGQECSIKLIE